MTKKLSKDIKVIECSNIDFKEKDVLYIKDWNDFRWLIGSDRVVYKLNKCYYLISEVAVWIYEDK